MELLKLLEAGRTAFLDDWFSLITHLGEETAFMLLAIVILWCVDKRKGYYLLCAGLLGTAFNTFLKLFYCIPRPWIRDPQLSIVESARAGATGYSFPSGHTQTAVGLYGGIARATKKRILRYAMLLLALLVSFSRLYLGVHTPADVMTSIVIGTVLVFALYPFFSDLTNHPYRGVIALSINAVVSLFVLLHAAFAPLPENAVAALSSHGLDNAYKMFGCSLGALIGFCIDRWRLHYETSAPLPVQFIKCGLGLAITLGIRVLLKAPLMSLFAGHPVSGLVRYLMMALFVSVVWPSVFRFFPADIGVKTKHAA